MRFDSLTIVVGTAFALTGCSPVPLRMDGSALVPPPDAYLNDRYEHILKCDAEAKAAYQAGVSLTEQERAPLQGRSTVEFYFQGRPAVDGEFNPSLRESLMGELGGYGPPDLTDRYVLCLLNRGYTWPPPPPGKR